MRFSTSFVLAVCLAAAPAAAQSSSNPAAEPQASQAGRRQITRPAGTTWTDRVLVSANAGWQSVSTTFDDSRTFPLYAETARFTSDYEVKSNTAIDVGAAVRLWRGLGIGAAFTRFTDSRDIAISATLPHPFLFDRDRSVSGTAAGEREESAAHVQAVFVAPIGRRVQLAVFGGPSFFSVKQTVVTDIDYREDFPFDEATFTRATTETESESKVGFTVGADVAWFFSRNVGVGGIVRFARATVETSLGELDAGGVIAGGGLRLRF